MANNFYYNPSTTPPSRTIPAASGPPPGPYQGPVAPGQDTTGNVVGNFDANSSGLAYFKNTPMDVDYGNALQMYNTFLQDRNRPSATFDPITGQVVAAPTVQDTQGQEVRGRQMNYLDSLSAAANGQAPSVAEAQMERGQNAISAQQLGMAAQAHGNSGVFAREQAMRNIGQGQQQAGLDAAMLRAQEIATARGQLGGELGQVRATDTATAVENARNALSAGTSTAQLGEDAAARNQASGLEAQRITNQARQAASEEALAAAAGGRQATGQAENAYQFSKSRQMSPAQWAQGGFGVLNSVGGGVAKMSDERVKTDVHSDGDAEIDEFTRALAAAPHSFHYAPESGEPTEPEHHGLMTKELKHTRIGHSMVQEGSDGIERVDTGALTLALAGIVARMRHEMKGGRRG